MASLRFVVLSVMLLMITNVVFLVMNYISTAVSYESWLAQGNSSELRSKSARPSLLASMNVGQRVFAERVSSRNELTPPFDRVYGSSTVVVEGAAPDLQCRYLGPYPRAVNAAKVLNRLEEVGATAELIEPDSARLRALLLKTERPYKTGYWVRVTQMGLIQAAMPQELGVNSIACGN